MRKGIRPQLYLHYLGQSFSGLALFIDSISDRVVWFYLFVGWYVLSVLFSVIFLNDLGYGVFYALTGWTVGELTPGRFMGLRWVVSVWDPAVVVFIVVLIMLFVYIGLSTSFLFCSLLWSSFLRSLKFLSHRLSQS